MRPGALAAAALAAGVLAGGAVGAAREGGFSIRTAPEVVLGESEFGAPVTGARYWRIPLGLRDALTLDLRNKALSGYDRPIRFCLLAPRVNDANLARSSCVSERTLRRGETYRLRFSASSGGSWTLGAVSGACSSFQGCATASQTSAFIYEFTARVQRFTRTTLRGPRVVRPGARVGFAGVVTGADGGRIELRVVGSPPALVRLSRSGGFAWTTRAPSEPGAYRVRAAYRGDGAHLPSAAALSFRVAR